MHRGRSAAGFPATGAWDSVGASTRGLHRTRFVFVGHRNKASDSGSPFVEFPRSGRKIEEQLRAPGPLLASAAAKPARIAMRFDF